MASNIRNQPTRSGEKKHFGGENVEILILPNFDTVGDLFFKKLVDTSFSAIFLPRRLTRCRKRHQSIYSRVKGKQCRIY